MHYGFYLVAFVDILGQQDELKQLMALPHTTASKDAVMKLVRSTAGKVKRVREAFNNFFESAAQNRQRMVGLTAEQIAEYNKLRTLTFHQIGFSDSFVVSVPLIEHDCGAATAAIGVWAAMYGIAGMCLASMAEGVPLRAGVDVERGIDIYPNEVYGPVILKAYELECKVAEYPRAVVGDGLIAYVDYLRNLELTTRWNSIAVAQAKACDALLCNAPDDGRPMLHMLSPTILTIGDELSKPAAVAYEWSKREFQRFQAADNKKLTDYYGRLLQYFNAHGFNG